MRSRREFLRAAARTAPVLGAAGLAAGLPRSSALASAIGASAVRWDRADRLLASAPRARYWVSVSTPGVDCRACHDKVPDKPFTHDPTTLRCQLCAQGCMLLDGQRGRCRARANVRGELRTLVYGRPMAVHVDPIEKKPFYHFLPGSDAFSLATSGCPLRCKFCQNWSISQASPEDYETPVRSAGDIVAETQASRAPVIAFTYNEPTVFAEYLLDIAAAARAQRLRPVMVSCGFMNEAPLADMCRALDAIKIDLKGFSESFYRDVCQASLAPVMRSITQIARSGVHLEIVNLVVPTLNDSDLALGDLATWLAGEIGPDVPVHFTRFHPDYQLMNLPPTPVATLERARALAINKGLRYVYVGNVPDHPGNHTYCPGCGRVVIRRSAFFVTEMNMKNSRCAACGYAIAGVWV